MAEVQMRVGSRLLVFRLQSVCRLQAAWRGWYVRRKMREAKEDFFKAAADIEEADGLGYSLILPKMWLPLESMQHTVIRKDKVPKSKSQLQNDEEQKDTTEDRLEGGRSTAAAESNSDNKDSQCKPTVSTESDSTNSINGQQRMSSNNKICSTTPSPSSSPTHHKTSQGRASALSYRESLDGRDNTSVWDTLDASGRNDDTAIWTGMNVEDLEQERNQALLELYWVQQAIDSRKQYLRFKDQLTAQSAR